MKKIILLFILSFLAVQANAQIGVSYLHSNMISTIGGSYQFNDRIWSEIKVGVSVQNFTPHIQANYNVLKREKIDFYVAAAYAFRYGVTTSVSNGGMTITVGSSQVNTFLPGLGFNISPFDDAPNLMFSAEGLIVANSLDAHLQGSFGIRFILPKKGN